MVLKTGGFGKIIFGNGCIDEIPFILGFIFAELLIRREKGFFFEEADETTIDITHDFV